MDADKDCTALFSAAGGVGITEIVSLADDESYGDGHAVGYPYSDAELSGSSNFSLVAFRSQATNLTASPLPIDLFYARDRVAERRRALRLERRHRRRKLPAGRPTSHAPPESPSCGLRMWRAV